MCVVFPPAMLHIAIKHIPYADTCAILRRCLSFVIPSGLQRVWPRLPCALPLLRQLLQQLSRCTPHLLRNSNLAPPQLRPSSRSVMKGRQRPLVDSRGPNTQVLWLSIRQSVAVWQLQTLWFLQALPFRKGAHSMRATPCEPSQTQLVLVQDFL